MLVEAQNPPLVSGRRKDPSRTANPRRSTPARQLGRVDVHEDARAANSAWAELEAACPASVYQTRRFLMPWLATFGAARRVTPMIVVAHNSDGEPVALLPFGIVKRGPVSIAQFLGGEDSNANMGLFRPDVPFGPADLESLLRAAAAKARLKPDLFLLTNQPESFAGDNNPLDIFPHQSAASFSHGGALMPDPKAYLATHLSKDSAKKLRKKRKRLEDMGALRHIMAKTPLETAHILDAFFAQKLERFRQKNISSHFDEPASRAFLEQACCAHLDSGHPAIELHALALDDRIIATYGGGVHRGHLHLMFNAFDLDPEIARSSPGDLLLMDILQSKCAEGLKSFDLGIGEARYKDSWCDASEPMFDSVLAISSLGRAFSLAESSRRHAKRWIKQSQWAWPLAQRLMRRG